MSGGILTLMALAAFAAGLVLWSRRDLANSLIVDYSQEHRRFRTVGSKVSFCLFGLLLVSAPVGFSWIGVGRAHLPHALLPGLPLNEKWLYVGILAAIYSIGAIGMNLLIGNTGQVSLGHSGFVALGAYSTGYFGVDFKPFGHHIPSLVWLVIAAILGALVGAVIGPFALRLRGNYLAMVSILLVVGAQHVAKNWTSLTGGEAVPRNDLPPFSLTIWPGKTILFKDGSDANFFDVFFPTTAAAYFWLTWAVALLAIVLGRNVLRGRQGRAMMAVRDRDLSAEIIGVRQMYTKTWAFALSGGFAALAGALYASYFGTVQPDSFALDFSILFIVMIVIGGVGSVYGSVLGAVAVAVLKDVIDSSKGILQHIPGIQLDPAKNGVTLDILSSLIYGFLLIIFLMFVPTGLAGLWARLRRYFASWPFPS
jgi:branched-chain amino acid transport system permease protein